MSSEVESLGVERFPRIVSIQSQLVYGCAGNNAAVPLLQALGATVYAVPTVLMSNTPHYPTRAELGMSAGFVDELLSRFLDRVVPEAIDAVLVGYIRQTDIVPVVASFIDRLRTRHPGIVVLIDPVMGDTDLGLYVPREVADLICSELVPRANVLTPNLFEASVITGLTTDDPREVLAAVSGEAASTVLVTGIGLDAPGSPVQTSACREGDWWTVSTPYVAVRPTGTGDLLAAAFLFHWLTSKDLPRAVHGAAALVLDLLQQAARSGTRELEPWCSRVRSDTDVHDLIPLDALAPGMPSTPRRR